MNSRRLATPGVLLALSCAAALPSSALAAEPPAELSCQVRWRDGLTTLDLAQGDVVTATRGRSTLRLEVARLESLADGSWHVSVSWQADGAAASEVGVVFAPKGDAGVWDWEITPGPRGPAVLSCRATPLPDVSGVSVPAPGTGG